MGRVSPSRQNRKGQNRERPQAVNPIEAYKDFMSQFTTPSGINPDAPKPAAPAKPAQKPGVAKLPADYKGTELQAGQTAENHRAGAGFTGQSRKVTAPDGNGSSGTQLSLK